MTPKEAKIVKGNLMSILQFGKSEFGNDGFFYSEKVNHTYQEEDVIELIEKNMDQDPIEIYKNILFPLLELNKNSHLFIRALYHLLAANTKNKIEENEYRSIYFKHYILQKAKEAKGNDENKRIYSIILSRENSCKSCKSAPSDVYLPFDKVLNLMPEIIKKCEREDYCNAAISCVSEALYNKFYKNNPK